MVVAQQGHERVVDVIATIRRSCSNAVGAVKTWVVELDVVANLGGSDRRGYACRSPILYPVVRNCSVRRPVRVSSLKIPTHISCPNKAIATCWLEKGCVVLRKAVMY